MEAIKKATVAGIAGQDSACLPARLGQTRARAGLQCNRQGFSF